MEILIIFILVLINGVFAMSELSLVSARRHKLEGMARKGNRAAKTAMELADNPTRFLSTVQIGITLIGILLGVYSGESITKGIADILSKLDWLGSYVQEVSTGLSVILITYLSIVLGELFPKRLGLTYPEPVALLVSRPLYLLSKIAGPFVWLLTASNNLLLRIFRIKVGRESRVSEEEIRAIVRESAEGGEIYEVEQRIVERVFELGDKRIGDLQTPRSSLVYFDQNDGWHTVKEKINAEKHSAYPVCAGGNLDQIRGIVLVKDLFSSDSREFRLEKVLRKPIFVSEKRPAYQVLELFKKEGIHYAIVVDEYGSTCGMVTMDDVLDALLGNMTEHYQVEHTIVQRDENSWLVDGYYSLSEFGKYFGLKIGINVLRKYSTVGGLFIHYTQNIPELGDRVELEDYTLEVVDKDGQRIDKILVERKG